MKYHVLPSDIWAEPDFLGLSTESKIAYLYARTALACGVTGLVDLPLLDVAVRLGASEPDARAALAGCEPDLIAYDDATAVAWVRAKWSEQARSESHMRAAASELVLCRSARLVEEFLRANPEVAPIFRSRARREVALFEDERRELRELVEVLPRFAANAKLVAAWSGFVDRLAETYPTVDLYRELRKAHDWIEAKRATKKGQKRDLVRFLTGWVRRSETDARRSARSGADVRRSDGGAEGGRRESWKEVRRRVESAK